MASLTCYRPLYGWQRASGGPLFFGAEPHEGPGKVDPWSRVDVPCNGCIGCKEDYARMWAVRCYHEALTHERNCCVTLTYENAPTLGLNYEDFRLFLKRLRRSHGPVRYFVAGEYGAKTRRAHFHALLFGYQPLDMVPWAKSPSGVQMYRSKSFESLWTAGFSTVSSMSFAAAKYCAKYAAKKLLNGPVFDSSTGEVLPPEFVHMSRNPGLGSAWLQRHQRDVYQARDGAVCMQSGYTVKSPRYYDRVFAKLNPIQFEEVQFQRQSRLVAEDLTPERLQVREFVEKAKLKFFRKESDL